MATTDISDSTIDRIYPTENDIASVDYNGVNGHEVNVSDSLHWRNPNNCILADLDGSGLPLSTAGFEVSATGVGLNIEVTRGRAFISGRRIELLTGAVLTATVDDEKDNYIYLTLNVTGIVEVTPALKITVSPVSIGTGNPTPANSVLLAIVKASAGIIDSVDDRRPSQINDGVYVNVAKVQPIDNSKTRKPYIKIRKEGYSIGGMVILTNETNAVILNLSFDLIAEGPFGTVSKSYLNIPTGSNAHYISVFVSESIGRFKGNNIRLYIDNVIPVAFDYTIKSAQDYISTVLPFDYGATWALKEWDARG